MRSDGMVITMPPGLEISAHKGIFCLGSSWGNSDRLGWKLRVFLTLKPHKTQCQEQRDVAFLLRLLCQCLTGGGGRHWEEPWRCQGNVAAAVLSAISI